MAILLQLHGVEMAGDMASAVRHDIEDILPLSKKSKRGLFQRRDNLLLSHRGYTLIPDDKKNLF